MISRHVTLKRSGRRYTGLCPFHDDHNPSLTVDPEKQTYTCYACGEHGDVIDFLKKKNLSIQPFGVASRYAGKKSEAGASHEARASPDLNDVAKTLRQTEAYSTGNNLLSSSYLDFGVGVAPSYNLPREWKIMAGRIIFPIHNENGTLVGYAGRSQGDGSPKYINSPGLPRHCTLYGLDRARAQVQRTGMICLAEGFKDVIALHTAGITWAVGLMGTQLAAGQKELICRYADRVVLALDGDEAGRRAAAKIATELQAEGIATGAVPLPDGTDPDSLLRAEGPEYLSTLINRHTDRLAHPTEARMVTAVTLYQEEILWYEGEELLFEEVVEKLLKTENLQPEAAIHRQIVRAYTSLVQEIPSDDIHPVIEELQQTYGPGIDPSGLCNILLEYTETRLIRLIKTLARRLNYTVSAGDRALLLRDLSYRRTQLTAVSENLGTAAAIKYPPAP